jgi:undecaprenyl diphosphate synthase
MQSTLDCSRLHLAIIMDGNGRWATRQGLPRSAGHRAGMEAVRRTCEAAADLGIGTLTLFAFAGANWKRPTEEVDTLMWLFRAYLRADLGKFVERDARLSVIGRRDRLPARLRREIHAAEKATRHGRRMHLRVAIDYSAREAIARAAEDWPQGQQATPADFGRLVADAREGGADATEVDLLIRTGGEKRLSDFLLWEAAFAELWFTDRMWPEFGGDDLRAALDDFAGRERRFGGLLPASRPDGRLPQSAFVAGAGAEAPAGAA